ncbi:MAG TPA: AtpZ/AtpI family protein [Bacteroidales bacterium]|nr:AtpZ/AtpI family protein [Bacteroidales bacterium]
MKKINQDDKNKANNFIRYSSIGFQMMAIIGLGVWCGIEADEALKTSPLFTVLLSIISVGAAIYHAIKDFIKLNK